MNRLLIILLLTCAVAVAMPGCLPAQAQPSLPATNQLARTNLPTIDYGAAGYIIEEWSMGGRVFAQQIVTNVTSKAVLTTGSPKSGGTVSNSVQTFAFTTNQVALLRTTNGVIYGFKTIGFPNPAAPAVWEGMELVGLETTTNLSDPNSWQPVGWDTRREPVRFFRVRGTNDVAKTALYLKQITFTNTP